MFITTSAKTNTHVNLLFQKVTECVLENQSRSEGLNIDNHPATLGTLDTTSSSLQHPSASNERPLSPSAMNGFSNGPSFHGGPRIPTTPLSTLQESSKDRARSPVDGKRQRPDEENDVLDPAKTSPSGDSSTSKEGVNMSRCDPHSMLMCGDVVGAAGNGGGCIIQ
jgi:hypothetical protein